MKKLNASILLFAMAGSVLFSSCTGGSDSSTAKEGQEAPKTPVIKEEVVDYSMDSVTMKGFIAYDENISGPRPVVLIVHEWWGLNDYAKRRARDLASLGYLAMAVDMYGNGQTVDNPEMAGQLATPFYKDPAMAQKRFDAALNKVKAFVQADSTQIAAIGYCFGGAQVINMAKLGENLKGVVSFHGNLTVLPANKDLLKAPILVCHGDADPLVPATEVEAFKKQMDSIGAKYTFKAYAGATHAFTNPNATEMGKKFNLPIAYQAAADSSSWSDMQAFFKEIFK